MPIINPNNRYKDLEKRRKLEVEGFANDTMSLKRSLYKLESMYYHTQLSKRDQSSLHLGMLCDESIVGTVY